MTTRFVLVIHNCFISGTLHLLHKLLICLSCAASSFSNPNRCQIQLFATEFYLWNHRILVGGKLASLVLCKHSVQFKEFTQLNHCQNIQSAKKSQRKSCTVYVTQEDLHYLNTSVPVPLQQCSDKWSPFTYVQSCDQLRIRVDNVYLVKG